MEHFKNIFINVDYYSLLTDKKLCSRPHVKLKRLCPNLQRRYISKDGGMLGTSVNQTGKAESRQKYRSFKIFSETSAVKQTDDICNISNKDQQADSTSGKRASGAHCQLLNSIHDQISEISDRQHLYDPLLTQSQSSQILLEKDCVENISKETQPAGPFISSVDTGCSDRNHFNESLIDQESKTNARKTAISPVLLNKCAKSNTDCPLSTGMESINFSAKDSLGHSRNDDRKSDNGDCGTVDDENYFNGWAASTAGNRPPPIEMEMINSTVAEDSLGHTRNCDKYSGDDGDCSAVDESYLSGVIRAVKLEKDENTVNFVDSIKTVVNNNKNEDELVNKVAIKKKLDIQNAINVESAHCPYCNQDFVSLSRHTWRCRARRFLTALVPTVDPPVDDDNIKNDRPDPSDNELEPSDDEYDEPSDGDWLPSKKVNIKSRKINQEYGRLLPNSISARRRKHLETEYSTKMSPERDQTSKLNFGDKEELVTEAQSGFHAASQQKPPETTRGKNNSSQVVRLQIDASMEKTEKPKSDIHSENSAVNIQITCIHCESSIYSLEDLRGHVTVHINPASLNTDPDHVTTDTTDSDFVCRDCGEKLKNRDEYCSHWQQHDPKFSCFVCSKHFALLNELKVHVEWHFDVILHTCRQCSAKFSTSVMYDKHLSEHECGTKFKCNGCANVYLNLNEWKIHMQIHYIKNKNQKICPVCGKGLKCYTYMRSHFGVVHSTEKLYSYLEEPSMASSSERDQTSKSNFHGKDGLLLETQSGFHAVQQQKHPKTALGKSNSPQVVELRTDASMEKKEKPNSDIHSKNYAVNIPIKCIHCELNIDSLGDLRGHVTVHIDPASLNTDPDHVTTDTTDSDFVCPDCREKFKNRDEYYSHWQQHDPKFSCFVCDKRFALLNELKVHVEWHFDVILHTCQQCSAKFSTDDMYDKHLSEHKSGSKLKCRECDNEYLNFNQFKIHMQKHYIKKNQTVCPVCGRGLHCHGRMRRHFGTVHSTEKLYAYLEDPFEVTSNFPRKSRMLSLNLDKSLDEQPTSDIHGMNSVKKEPIKCMHCQSSFISLVDLLEHVEVHIDPALWKYDLSEKNPDFKLDCGDCAKTFSDQQAYVSHCHEHDANKPLRCPICDMRFRMPLSNLLRHNAAKHSEPKFPCFVCGKLLPNKHKCKAHVKRHFDGILYRCSQCSAGFSSKSEYAIHKSGHKGRTKFDCNVCAEEFPDDYRLKLHVRNTHNKKNKSSVCPICGRWCIKMQNHLASVHSTEKPFACKSCPKRFKLKCLLNTHVRVKHTEEIKTYKCNLCDECFKKKLSLQVHLLKHSGERPFACEICAKKFRTKDCAKLHMTTHRNVLSEKSFICKLCDKSFFYSHNLHDHTRFQHNSQKFVCNLCGKVLSRRQTLRKHMATHTKNDDRFEH